MNLTDLIPVLHWIQRQTAAFHDYVDRWVRVLDPGETDW